MACGHSGSHSGGARFVRAAAQLRLVLVCDACGAERAQLGRIQYRPRPERLAVYLAELTARELGLSDARTARVRFAAMVCRAGREQIPPEILNKRGPLTEDEWRVVRLQPELAAALLSDVSLNDIREWILCHRERPDGRGYPRGLSGEQIPLEARILAVSDAYTAMVSDRPHRPRRDHRAACRELLRCAGMEFDADVVQAFLGACRRGDALLERMAA
jgi:HD-GYP domain-containing protein (c-di-GMP phosphodiesterase class II)